MKQALRAGLLGASLLILGACALGPEPITLEEQAAQNASDRTELFSGQEPVSGPISLHEAMARALKYNMDNRLKVMETALASRQLTTANLSLLPSLTAEAGYTGRDNFLGSNSRSLLNQTESLESSSSSDRDLKSFDITMTWNVLDFGLSYVRARQQADRAMIFQERKRKVIQTIARDVRSTYWSAVSAERLLKRIDPLQDRVDRALADARRAAESRVERPLAALQYRRDLLSVSRQLKILRRELNQARINLATQLTLPIGTDFELADSNIGIEEPNLDLDVEQLERLALLHRPEIREEGYQARISHNDVRRAYLRLLPGIELEGGFNFDSNTYAYNQTWFSWGSTITKNLFDIFTAPALIAQAKAQEDVVKTRRLGLSLVIMNQVHVAVAGLAQAKSEYRNANELLSVEQGIVQQIKASVSAGSASERDAISAELQALLAELRRDLAFTEMRNAVSQIYVSIGANPMPDKIENDDLATLTAAIKEVDDGWFKGQINLEDLPKANAADGGPVTQPLEQPERQPTLVATPATPATSSTSVRTETRQEESREAVSPEEVARESASKPLPFTLPDWLTAPFTGKLEKTVDLPTAEKASIPSGPLASSWNAELHPLPEDRPVALADVIEGAEPPF
ncbi:MAG: TolC family protein [Magnetovibrionaceae bacterium]